MNYPQYPLFSGVLSLPTELERIRTDSVPGGAYFGFFGLFFPLSFLRNVADLDKKNVIIIRVVRPEFFYFLVLGKFLGKPRVGGGNKNKNKIQKFPESE